MEFDKSRIYGAVNADELKPGDRVIVSDCLRFLRQDVKEGGDIETLKEVLDESHLQRFKVMDDLEWGLAYLVERKENCTNCACHCEVTAHPEIDRCDKYKPKTEMPELISLGNGQYVEKKHTNYNHCEEAKKAYENVMAKAEPHYRPFRDTDELIKVWKEKWSDKTNGQKWHDCKLNMPHIWVRNKVMKSSVSLIIDFDSDGVMLQKQRPTWVTLFECFEFLDGSPCGVEA